MALTIARYARDNHLICGERGLEVRDMTITHPIVMPQARPTEPHLLRIAVTAENNSAQMEVHFGRHDVKRDETEWTANCTVAFENTDDWLRQWSKMGYLVESRIQTLEWGVIEGNTHKLLRGMVYRLFASCVDYDSKYQAMQEVLLNSEGLEATARLSLYQGLEGGSYHCSPFWLDALVHLGGFVMNANDAVDTQNAVYISGGWKSMRLGEPLDPRLPYRVHVKMIPDGEKSVAGDVSVLQGDRMVAYISDLKFQRVPHAVLNVIIPRAKPEIPSRSLHPINTNLPRLKVDSKSQSALSAIFRSPPSTADRVFGIIAEQASLNAKEIEEIDSFNDMGIDSLLSLQITAEIEHVLGLSLDSHLFQAHPTARDLRQHLTEQTPPMPANEFLTPGDMSASSTDTEDSMSTLNDAADDMLPALHSTIAEQLGVAVRELFEVHDLGELGLDSLMGLQIIGALQERFGVPIKPDALTGSPTIASIEKLMGISSLAIEPPPRTTNETLSHILQNQSSAHAHGRTVFLFPDGSGSPAIYASLRLNASTRVVALQSPFVRDPGAYGGESIEDLTKLWTAELRRLQPHGPYILAGYSAGGYYAFEAARQLLALGCSIEHLILIDSPCTTAHAAMPPSLPSWLADRGVLTAGATARGHFAATIQAVQRYAPAPLSASTPPFRVTIAWASQGAAPRLNKSALPPDAPLAGITQWLLQRPSASTPLSADGWDALLPGQRITLKSTSGHHFNVLSEPNVSHRHSLLV
jgi:iterative type I PKS product template protein